MSGDIDRRTRPRIMNGMTLSARTLILALILTAPLLSAAAAPPPQSTPNVTVHIERSDVAVDHSLSHRQIKSLLQCRRPAMVGEYVGLSTADFRARFATRVTVARDGAAVVGGLVSVNVTLSVGARKIYIASEFPKDSCSYEQTRAHELHHARIDDEVATLFAPRLAAAVRAAAWSLTSIRGTKPEDITAAVHASLNLVMEQQMRALQAFRDTRQAQLDSRSEYKRLSEACHGETEALVRAAERDESGWYDDVDCPGP